MSPAHPRVQSGRSSACPRGSLHGILVTIQVATCGSKGDNSFENQKCVPLASGQTVLQPEHTMSMSPQCRQVCDLCKVESGRQVTISQAWKNALWVAEKQVVTRIQPLVQSPILTRYAGAAYSLRQKPFGHCCKACETWVFKQHLCSEPLADPSPLVAKIWPQLSEAALSGPRYFQMDFANQGTDAPGVTQEGTAVQRARESPSLFPNLVDYPVPRPQILVPTPGQTGARVGTLPKGKEKRDVPKRKQPRLKTCARAQNLRPIIRSPLLLNVRHCSQEHLPVKTGVSFLTYW